VGFADIAGFTRLSRAMAEDELAGMVEAFETGAADIVAAHGARLVKTLGDEVMFIAPGADAAVASATAMHRLEGPGPEALRLRIGLATGRLVTLMGDAYGETVNRASRLTAIARPGTTLMDTATEESLSEPASYVLRHHRPRGLRGLGMVRATSVARREA
jgi:adenylate cyclase